MYNSMSLRVFLLKTNSNYKFKIIIILKNIVLGLIPKVEHVTPVILLVNPVRIVWILVV